MNYGNGTTEGTENTDEENTEGMSVFICVHLWMKLNVGCTHAGKVPAFH